MKQLQWWERPGLEYHIQPGHGSHALSLEVEDVHSDPFKQKQELSLELTHPTVLFSDIVCASRPWLKTHHNF